MYIIKDNVNGTFLTGYSTQGGAITSYAWGSWDNAIEFETQNQTFIEAIPGESGQFSFIGKNPKPR